MKKPPISSKRKHAFNLALEIVPDNPNIVEIGMARLKGNWQNDGHSTIVFSWLVNQRDGELTSIDVDPNTIQITNDALSELKIPTNNISLLTGDGMEFAKTYTEPIDLLYLDAWDYNGEQSSDAHYDCFMYFFNNECLPPGSLIMIDDILDNVTYRGKGERLIPYMLDVLKCDMLINDYAVLLRMK